jgi:hypothetical protein
MALLAHRDGRHARSARTSGAGRHVPPTLQPRVELPAGPDLCVIDGPTRGRPWSTAATSSQLRRVVAAAAARRRFAPHQLRHADAVGLGPRGCAADRHPTPARAHRPHISSIDLQGVDNAEISDTVHARRPDQPRPPRPASKSRRSPAAKCVLSAADPPPLRTRRPGRPKATALLLPREGESRVFGSSLLDVTTVHRQCTRIRSSASRFRVSSDPAPPEMSAGTSASPVEEKRGEPRVGAALRPIR